MNQVTFPNFKIWAEKIIEGNVWECVPFEATLALELEKAFTQGMTYGFRQGCEQIDIRDINS